jgi:peptidoglycan/LPS O-acetylase OafA/YrhL
VLSICWVIYGHDQWFRLSNIKNWTESLDILTTPGIPTLAPAAYFAVDTFFWVGGFLVTLGMLEQAKKVKSVWKFFLGSVSHRFIRIWPTYMMAILMFWKIGPYFGSGPIWRTFYTLACSCNNGGVLWNMFFIDNFGYHGATGIDYCFGWGWYLAVDFQLFAISPFIMYAYHRNKKLGWAITFGLFMASVITAFILIMVNDWRYPIPNPKFPVQADFMDNFYYKPYVRASAYLMGLMTGYVYVEYKANNEAFVNPINKLKNSIVARVLFYVVGIALCELVIWIIVPYQQG